MPSYTLSSADKPPSKIFWPFLTLHGLLFLGIGYILFTSFELFALVHAFIGILIYLIFWSSYFPHLFRDVVIGAGISVLTGLIFGDILLDKFFWLYEKTPRGLIPRAYSSLVVFYLYFYIALVKRVIFDIKK